MGSSTSTTRRAQDHHCPTPEDVLAVRSLLLAFLPAELVNLILDEAEYWPKVTLGFKEEQPLALHARDQGNNATVCCLVTPKLRDLIDSDVDQPIKVKVVCFEIVSHDQGWCDENNFPGSLYQGSHTWFEAVIVRDFIFEQAATSDTEAEIKQALNLRGDDTTDTWMIQRNKRANGDFQLHTVTWMEEEETDESISMNETGGGLGGGFVKSLRKDDRIAVMARAQYPGWANYIKSVELNIYYSV